MSEEKIRRHGSSFDPTEVRKVLANLRASIGMIHYLNYRGIPDVNQRLTNVVNNVGAQWNHGQAMWNADPANASRQTTVGDFWSEWIQDYYVWLIRHTSAWAQDTIWTMRGIWAARTGDDARTVLERIANLEAQLVGLAIDTTRMN
jgi:chitinase